MSSTEHDFIDHAPVRVHGDRIVDTYVMATRFRHTPDGAIHHAIDGDDAEQLLFAIVQAHHAQRLVAKYEWLAPFEVFLAIMQMPAGFALDDVDVQLWYPDTSLADLDRALAPGVGHEFTIEEMPVSVAIDVVSLQEYDRAMRPVTTP